MRLGAPLLPPVTSPEQWIGELHARGYRAAYCPLGLESGSAERAEYRAAAREADIVIAEVGAWSNPLSPDREEADAAFRKMVAALRLADEVGARCTVNIAGSRGAKWDGPDPRDLTDETFEQIVGLCQAILEEADPRETFLTVEPMPWMYPHSAQSYARLLEAVDHPRFGVHYDPVNLVNSPIAYFRSGAQIREFVELLGPDIVSVHAKDIVLQDRLTTHLDECIPGTGGLDYQTLLGLLATLDPDLPLMLEHLEREAEYDQGAASIRAEADRLGLTV